jgi:hypothetical protein
VNKYNAKPTEIDGIRFDSLAESRRYSELRLLERAGAITDLRVHPRYRIWPTTTLRDGTKQRATYYVADFAYREGDVQVAEDVKGGKATQVALWRLKWKMARALYPDVDWRVVEA